MVNRKTKKALAFAVALGTVSAMGAGKLEAAQVVELPVESVSTNVDEGLSEEQVVKLVPELKKHKVNVRKLSKQIQLVNDGKAMEMNADFRRQADGNYKVVLTAKKLNEQSIFLSGNNTGNDYTGDWRMGATYLNRNVTNHGDSVGLAYVTSPGHWEDVKQAAVVYRSILPEAGDSFYIAGSWSDVDLGTIGNFGGLGVAATGRGKSVGAHYQHNIRYTSAKKQIVDLGIDQKNYDNATIYSYGGIKLNDQLNYEFATASANYFDINRKGNQFWAWNLGYTGNVSSDDNFRLNRAQSSRHFHLWKAGVNYQSRTKGDVIFGARANGQFTNSDVISTEQFGAGGLNTVRGFMERTAYADKGYMGTLEVYSPELGKGSRFVAFTDYARLWNNHAGVGELACDDIGSYGVGFRHSNKKLGLNVSIDCARAYTNISGVKGNRRPWQVSLTKEF